MITEYIEIMELMGKIERIQKTVNLEMQELEALFSRLKDIIADL